MALSKIHFRETLLELNHLAYIDEKHIDHAQNQANTAQQAIIDLEGIWEAKAKTADDAVSIGIQLAFYRNLIVDALTEVKRANGDLETLAERYAPVLDEISAKLAAEPSDVELSSLKDRADRLKSERISLHSRGMIIENAITQLGIQPVSYPSE